VITTGAAGWGWLWRSWLGRLWRRWKWILAVPFISSFRAIDVVPIHLARVGNNTTETYEADGYGVDGRCSFGAFDYLNGRWDGRCKGWMLGGGNSFGNNGTT